MNSKEWWTPLRYFPHWPVITWGKVLGGVGVILAILAGSASAAGLWTQLGAEFYSGNSMSSYRMSMSGSTPTLAYVEGNTGTVRTLYVKQWNGSQWTTTSSVPLNAALSTSKVRILALDGLVPYLSWTQKPYPDQQNSYCIAKYENGQWTVLVKAFLSAYAVPEADVLRMYQGTLYLTGYILSPDTRMYPNYIYFSRWNGSSWGNGASIDIGTLTPVFGDRSLVVSDAGQVYLSFMSYNTIYIKKRLPSGNWESLPSPQTGTSGAPKLYVQNEVLYAVWYQTPSVSGAEIKKFVNGQWESVCTQLPIYNLDWLTLVDGMPYEIKNRWLEHWQGAQWLPDASLANNSTWSMAPYDGAIENNGNTLCVTWRETDGQTQNRFYAGLLIRGDTGEPTATPTPTYSPSATPTPLVTPGLTATPAAPPGYTNNQAAAIVVGQTNMFNAARGLGPNALYWPQGISSDGIHLVVADGSNNRVLIFNHIPSGNNARADVVIGQADMWGMAMNYGGLNARSLCGPVGVFYDGTRLFVADSKNSRVLIYHQLPTTNYAAADVVIGQPDMLSGTQNNGGITAQSLRWPSSVYYDGQKLYVADSGNDRVLIYNQIPTGNFAAADIVVGQNDMITVNNPPPLNAQSLWYPMGVQSDGTRLYVADFYNSRVLIYNHIPVANHTAADVVVGQPDMASNASNNGGINANTLCRPNHVYSDGRSLYVADTANNRILVYKDIPASNHASADIVLGQPDMTSRNSTLPSATTLGSPYCVFPIGGSLFVTDQSYNRVLIYHTLEADGTPTYTATPTQTAPATSTPTLTLTPTPTETPNPNDVWLDHFNGIEGERLYNWVDANYQPNFNAFINYASTSSWARVSRTSTDVWGKVLSPTLTLDAVTYPLVQIKVTALANCTWKVGIQEQEGAYRYWDLNSSSNQTGEFTFNYDNVTGWGAGLHVFSVQVVVEGGAGSYLDMDWVKITRTGTPPTATPTPTVTSTPTFTQTPIPTVTPTPRPGIDGQWEMLGNVLNPNPFCSTGAEDLYVSGATPYIAWTESLDNNATQIYVKHWNGNDWLSDGGRINPNFSAQEFYPSVASANSTPYVASIGHGEGNRPILIVRQYVGGQWVQVGEPLQGNISTPNAFGRSDLSVYQGTPYVIWAETDSSALYGVYVSHWNGSVWVNDGGDLLGGSPNGYFYADNPTLGFSESGQLYACFHGNHPNDGVGVAAYVKKLVDGQWVAVGTPVAFPSYTLPRMAVGGEAPYVVTLAGDSGADVCVYKFNGAAWEQVGAPVNGALSGGSPDVFAQGNQVFVAYTEGGHPAGQLAVKHYDGSQWISDGFVNLDLTHDAYLGRINSDGTYLYCAWLETLPTDDRQIGVFCKRRSLASLSTPTPTPSMSGTATPTRTMTPTASSTPTESATPTGTRTGTATRTRTITVTMTRTATPTVTRTVTKTVTRTSTPTVTRTATRTATRTITRTATRTITRTSTRTITRTATRTITRTATRTATPTATRTRTRTATRTVTRTATRTATPTTTSNALVSGAAAPEEGGSASSVASTFTATPADLSPTKTSTPTLTSTTTTTVTPVPNWMIPGEATAFPNPARGKVTFAYRLEGTGTIMIDVYRLTGERVTHIEERRDGGTGQTLTTTWDAAGVAPGVYFCRIVVTDAGSKEVLNVKKKVALIR